MFCSQRFITLFSLSGFLEVQYWWNSLTFLSIYFYYNCFHYVQLVFLFLCLQLVYRIFMHLSGHQILPSRQLLLLDFLGGDQVACRVFHTHWKKTNLTHKVVPSVTHFPSTYSWHELWIGTIILCGWRRNWRRTINTDNEPILTLKTFKL